MPDPKPVIVITGAAGNLGVRLLPQLTDFLVYAVDVVAPPETCGAQFERIDLAEPASYLKLLHLLQRAQPCAVVHLAFIIDPMRMGVLDIERMWQINVAGTGRVLDAIAEANRSGARIAKFVYPSSVSAYGPELPAAVSEDYPLGAHTLPYAIHKQEAEELLRKKTADIGPCSTYVLRPHIYAGASMQNYLIGVLRGTPTGRGRIAKWLRDRDVRLPLVLPFGHRYPKKQFQFVHVDDVARLIGWVLHRKEGPREDVVLNVPGKGPAITLGRAAQIARARVVRLPGRISCRWLLQLMWRLGISGVPPAALPYMIGSYTMDSSRLRAFLGNDFDQVMQCTVEQALTDSFRTPIHAGGTVAVHAASPP